MRVSSESNSGEAYDDRQSRTRERFWAVVLGIAGVGILGFGVFSVQQHIVGPFRSNLLAGVPKNLDLEAVSNEQEIQAQKARDTDKDGLNDFDEINIYGTSPYLADSDSDGIADKKEVTDGTDPNCAKGTDCQSVRLVTPDTRISDLFPQFSTSTISLKDKTIKEFRQILVEQGFDPQKLAEISDQSLLLILEESLKAQDLAAQGETETRPLTPEELDQVRQFLIELGVPRDEVYSMSNKEVEDLLKTFK